MSENKQTKEETMDLGDGEDFTKGSDTKTTQGVVEMYGSMVESYAKSAYEDWQDMELYTVAVQNVIRERVDDHLRVIDVGCGSGTVIQDLIDNFGIRPDLVTGIDVTPSMIEYCREKISNVNFMIGDAANIPVEDGTQDVLINMFVIHHLKRGESSEEKSGLNNTLREWKRILKSGGKGVLAYWVGDGIFDGDEYFQVEDITNILLDQDFVVDSNEMRTHEKFSMEYGVAIFSK